LLQLPDGYELALLLPKVGGKLKQYLNQNGLTLIEVLLSMLLLTIILIPLLGSLTQSAFVYNTSSNQTQAVLLARQKMEEIKALSYQDIPANIPKTPFTSVTGYAYTINTTEHTLSAGGKLKIVQITVYYPANKAEKSYQLTGAVSETGR